MGQTMLFTLLDKLEAGHAIQLAREIPMLVLAISGVLGGRKQTVVRAGVFRHRSIRARRASVVIAQRRDKPSVGLRPRPRRHGLPSASRTTHLCNLRLLVSACRSHAGGMPLGMPDEEDPSLVAGARFEPIA